MPSSRARFHPSPDSFATTRLLTGARTIPKVFFPNFIDTHSMQPPAAKTYSS
jgi:hypothetical protein